MGEGVEPPNPFLWVRQWKAIHKSGSH